MKKSKRLKQSYRDISMKVLETERWWLVVFAKKKPILKWAIS